MQCSSNLSCKDGSNLIIYEQCPFHVRLILLADSAHISVQHLISESREGSFPLGQEQSHKWGKYYIFVQNIKTLGIWVIWLIKCLTFIFLNQYETFNSHLYHNNLSLKYEFVYYNIPQAETLSYNCWHHFHITYTSTERIT